MADTPPAGKRKRGRPRKQPEGAVKPAGDLPIDDLAQASAAAAGAGGDTPPGEAAPEGVKRKPRKPRISKQMTKQIEDALAEILQIPAVPASILGDEWAANHFTEQGRALAERIAIVSERNPVLRGWCEKAMEGESMAVLLMAAAMYGVPPLMHLGIVPGGAMLGVPVIGRMPAPEGIPMPPVPDDNANLGREAPKAREYGGEAVEVVEPEFVGGSDNGEPPTWRAEMLG